MEKRELIFIVSLISILFGSTLMIVSTYSYFEIHELNKIIDNHELSLRQCQESAKQCVELHNEGLR